MDLSLISRTTEPTIPTNWTYKYTLSCPVRRDVTLGQVDDLENSLIPALGKAGLRLYAAPVIKVTARTVVLSLSLLHGRDPDGRIRLNVEQVIQSNLVPALEPLMVQ